MISIGLLGVAAERGEDPVVDGSHGGEKGGGVKMTTTMDATRGVGEGGGGTAKSSMPPPPLMPPEQLPTSTLQSLELGTTTVFTIPQRSAFIARLVFQYLLIRMYSFC